MLLLNEHLIKKQKFFFGQIIVYTFLIAETHALILTIEPLNNFF